MSYSYIGNPDIGYFRENNPFLSMIAAVDEEPQAGGSAPPANVEQQQPQRVLEAGRVKLPDFWPHAPGIWFARAELRFETSGVASERQRFAYTVDALPYETLCHVVDLVESPPDVEPYTVLKERLMLAHQLTPVEKAIKLMELPALGDRRPSQLLADLLQACPPGEQQSAFFRGAFISRLPAELQAHLTGIDTANLKELAQRADQLWTTHRRPAPLAAVAAAAAPQAEEEAMVAAVQSKAGGKGKQGFRKKKLITYCFLHHKYGKDARRCDNPESCMWQGN
jgi:hypothetical protein